MKIKTLWGFIGDAEKLKSDSRQIKRGQVFDDVDDEYANLLIGQGLAVQVTAAAPTETKPAAPQSASSPAPQAATPAAPASVNAGQGEQDPPKSADDEKAELLAKLEAANIAHDKRWGVAKLREALAGAESK